MPLNSDVQKADTDNRPKRSPARTSRSYAARRESQSVMPRVTTNRSNLPAEANADDSTARAKAELSNETGTLPDAARNHSAPAGPPPKPTPMRLRGPASASSARSRMWLIVPIGLAGIIVASIVAWTARPLPAHTVSEVTREIRQIVLHRSERPGVEDGGPFGEWWIAAREADAFTGTFAEFRLRTDRMRVAAKTAKLHVDPQANTISFALADVVIVRLPASRAATEGDHFVVELESLMLGPIPYPRRITPDGHPAARREPQPQLAGAQTE
jgi:hypothetical protein